MRRLDKFLGNFLRRVDSAPDAADLLAETYLIAWRKIDTVPADETARLWLYGVARRVASHYHRHERVEQCLAEALPRRSPTQCGSVRTDGEMPFGEVIATSIERLNPTDREIIELSAWEQFTPTEIANVIGMNSGAIRVRLHRIRNVIRTDLLGAGYPRSDPLDRVG